MENDNTWTALAFAPLMLVGFLSIGDIPDAIKENTKAIQKQTEVLKRIEKRSFKALKNSIEKLKGEIEHERTVATKQNKPQTIRKKNS